MTPKETRSHPDSGQDLRQRAEALTDALPEDAESLSPELARRALHELRVHQIELEMQNEELRRTQEELEISRARYFDLFDLAPVGYLTLSEQGMILEANLTAAKLLDVARSALVRQPFSRFVLSEDQDIYYLHRKALLETGDPGAWEMRMLKKDAAPIWVRLEATTALDTDGVSVCRFAVSDITESKRTERALKSANTELQDFAFALTHDLREPLRMVVTFTRLLSSELAGTLSEEVNQYMAYSLEGALRMDALLTGLLNYWDITGRGGDGESLVDCNDVLSQTRVSLQMSIQQSGAAVTSDPLPTVAGIEVMLTQLFQNLIENSIKYRSKATPAIHLSASRTEEGWLFAVRDNGIGIDPEHAEHIFGMFKRLHGREIPGTGIGLALCRKLVERQGGRIWVESKAGQGSIFKFTIPVERRL